MEERMDASSLSSRFVFVATDEVAERRSRQDGGTLYHQLLAQGFSAKTSRRRPPSPSAHDAIALIAARQAGSEVPMLGVAYGGDRPIPPRATPQRARAPLS